MRKQIEPVRHKGVVVNMTHCETAKNGVVYESYQVSDYSSGKRKRWTFASSAGAGKKAGEFYQVEDLKKITQQTKELIEKKGSPWAMVQMVDWFDAEIAVLEATAVVIEEPRVKKIIRGVLHIGFRLRLATNV